MAKKGGLTTEMNDDDEMKESSVRTIWGREEEPCNERGVLYRTSRALLPAKTETSNHVASETYLGIHHDPLPRGLDKRNDGC